MKSLRECWEETGQRSDKGPTCHSYLPFYEALLSPYRHCASAILEIGVFHGASLDMWRLFFDPQIAIWGVDMNPDPHRDTLERWEGENVHVLLRVDAYLPSTVTRIWKQVPNGFDVIIDDGSHIEEHQVFALHEYGKLLNPGGVMVIEDVQPHPPNGHPDLPGNLIATMDEVDYGFESVELVDRRKEPPYRYDDLLVVVRK